MLINVPNDVACLWHQCLCGRLILRWENKGHIIEGRTLKIQEKGIYSVVEKKCPFFENSHRQCPTSQFRQVLAQFSELSAIPFAQPCRCSCLAWPHRIECWNTFLIWGSLLTLNPFSATSNPTCRIVVPQFNIVGRRLRNEKRLGSGIFPMSAVIEPGIKVTTM